MSKVRIALVGYGYWGPNYFRNFQTLDDVEIDCICDSNPKAFSKLRRSAPGIKTLNDYDELLKDAAIDAVVISTPAISHYEMARKALLAGKHVLVEKPLSLQTEHVKELVALSESRKKILMVGHTFLYNPAVRKMKSLIQEGVVGEIYYLQAVRTHLGLIRNDVSAIWDLAPHDVSIFNYLLERKPVKVSALGASYLNPLLQDVAFINLDYGNNVLGNIRISWVDSQKQRQVLVTGSKGCILFDDLNSLEKIRIFEKGISIDKPYRNFGEFQLLLRDGNIISPKIGTEEPLNNVCREFIQSVKTGNPPVSDGKSSLNVVSVMCAIHESIKKSGEPVVIA